MTDERILEIKARAEAATPGPWENGWSNGVTGPTAASFVDLDKKCGIVSKPKEVFAGEYYAGVICRTAVGRDADAQFIAYARTDIPDLLRHIATLTEQICKLEKDLDEADRDNIALTAALEAAEGRAKAAAQDIVGLLEQEDYLGLCWACAKFKTCAKGHECTPEWRGPAADTKGGQGDED